MAKIKLTQTAVEAAQPQAQDIELRGYRSARLPVQDYPGGAKAEARKAPTMAELCTKFMEDYSNKRNKPSTPEGYQGVIHRCIIPLLGRKKVQDVKRPDIAGLMEKLSYKPTEANKAFGVLRKMFNLAEVWGYRPDGTNPCRHVPMFPPGKETRLIVDGELALNRPGNRGGRLV